MNPYIESFEPTEFDPIEFEFIEPVGYTIVRSTPSAPAAHADSRRIDQAHDAGMAASKHDGDAASAS